jgi:hypothetical protein
VFEVKHNITTAALLQLGVEVLGILSGVYGLRHALNRANQALERSAAAEERTEDDLGYIRIDIEERNELELHREREKRTRLPTPSLLHPAALKPIPGPDPEPCSADQFTCADIQSASSNKPDCRNAVGVPVPCGDLLPDWSKPLKKWVSLPMLGGTAHE